MIKRSKGLKMVYQKIQKKYRKKKAIMQEMRTITTKKTGYIENKQENGGNNFFLITNYLKVNRLSSSVKRH